MNVATLATTMNVTENDVNSLLRMVSSAMIKDGIAEQVVTMSEEDRQYAVSAYVQSEVKKFHNFCVSLLTNTEKKSAFEQYVLTLV